MQSMIYPVNGDLSCNVKITILPAWMEFFIGRDHLFIPAFRRLWMSPHATSFIKSNDDLVAYNGHIAYAYTLLCEQEQFPAGGIGWWIERFADMHTAMEQDIYAFAACQKDIAPGNSLWVACAAAAEEYHVALGHPFQEFFQRVNERARALAEVGGI